MDERVATAVSPFCSITMDSLEITQPVFPFIQDLTLSRCTLHNTFKHLILKQFVMIHYFKC